MEKIIFTEQRIEIQRNKSKKLKELLDVREEYVGKPIRELLRYGSSHLYGANRNAN